MEDYKKDAYVEFGKKAKNYHKKYSEKDFSESYPADRFRLNIYLDILKQIKPNRVLDVGCGSGKPLIEMLEQGLNAYGFDFSDEMVASTKEKLEIGGHESDRVFKDNLENLIHVEDNSFDCITAMGSIYYARDFDKAMKDLVKKIKPGGDFIFSLRNQLFSLFSFNKYSVDFFLNELLDATTFSEDIQKDVLSFFNNKFKSNVSLKKFKTTDDQQIHSIYHNPLTISKIIKEKYNLDFVDNYFYHFHALPPEFEHKYPLEFRKANANIENGQDWKGHFLCSAFIVHAKKP